MAKKLISALAISVASIAISANGAGADTKSWSDLKPHVVARGLVVGVDVDALRSTTVFPAVLDQITKDDTGPKTFIDGIKRVCGVDATSAITDITVNFDLEHDTGVIAVGLDIDRAKFDDCFTKAVANGQPGKAPKTVKIETKGHVTLYAMGDQVFPLAWIGKDVVAFKESLFGRPKAADADALEAFLTGKSATAMMQSSIARANSNKPVWFAANGLSSSVSELIGNVSIDKGTITLMAKMVATNGAAAAQATTDAKAKLDRGTKKSGVPDDALRVLKAIKITQTGTTVSIDGSISDKDAKAAIQVFDKVF